MKRLILSFIFLLLCSSQAFAQEDISPNNISLEQNEILVSGINSKNTKELKEGIIEVYGKENADKIFDKVMFYVNKAKKERPKELVEQDIIRKDDWYKDEIIYMFYVDRFGIISDDKSNTFKDSAKMFDYLQDLGVTTLYMLPFADSPMKDAGFDVKNPRGVRHNLGGMGEFKEFAKIAKNRGFKIKADLVLNHLSDDHEWFKRLEEGDLTYLDYFIWRENVPPYKKYKDEKLGTVIEYQEDDGTISKRRLIFPDNMENNWRKVTVNNKDYYLYHTFYPFQLDINWENPEVLYYMLETISQWANLGVDIFRMDAIPYLSKEKGTNAENQPKTHSILKILSNYLQMTAPSTVIQAEACQLPKDILPYFGQERTVDVEISGEIKPVKRTSEAQIAYHFPYMDAIWASLITEDKKYFVDVYKKTPQIPHSASWGMFLRLHDELTLEMVSPEIREIIFNNLVEKGANFRDGFGVSGRLANFLDKNPNRIEGAFSILLSLPDIPIIYYGDEVGVSNNFEEAKKAAKKREKDEKNLTSSIDTRDIHRNEIPQKLLYGSTKGYYEFNSKVYKKIKNLIRLRKHYDCLTRGDFILLKTASKSNFAYIRKNKEKQILVINNLSKEKLVAEVSLPADIILKKKGKITSLKNLINGDNIKVNISLQNRTMHLRVAPYQILWLEL